MTPGDIVEVPFGKEKAIGVVWPSESFEPKDIKIKNIHKKIESGSSRLEAALSGSKEVIFAIISTSVVLISIFIPIVFLEGDTAKLFKELAVTIIGAIFFSTIISLTLTPMLCSKIISERKKDNKRIEKFYKKLGRAR